MTKVMYDIYSNGAVVGTRNTLTEAKGLAKLYRGTYKAKYETIPETFGTRKSRNIRKLA